MRQSVSVSGVLTFSMYLKYNSGTVTAAALFCTDNNNSASFDLSTGSITSENNLIDSSIEDIGGGWYRCSITLNTSSASTMILFPNNGAGIGSCFAWNAQLETGLVSSEYLNSTSVTGKAGVLIDLPRIDYSSGAGALLLEPQRANLITQSEYFDASQWTHYSSTISSNDSTSPDGFENATRWTSTASGTFLTTSLSISDPCNLSVFVKYVDHPYIQLYSGASGGYYANFDIQNNTIGTSGYNTSNEKIESYGNGWYRISCTFANVSAGSTARIGFAQSLTEGWGGLNTSAVGDVLIYGAQLEAGSYATSYIPNHGESGGVTRAADSCSVTGASDVIGQTEGTLFLEMKGFENGGLSRRFTISDGSLNNRVALELDEIASRIRAYIVGGGANDGNLDIDGIDQTQNHKIGIVYNGSSIRMSIDGSTPTFLSTSVTTSGMNRIQFFNSASTSNEMFGAVKQAILFDEALSDSELETLTTL